jgi:hypothetical protein
MILVASLKAGRTIETCGREDVFSSWEGVGSATARRFRGERWRPGLAVDTV